jgi:hypothetical protein
VGIRRRWIRAVNLTQMISRILTILFLLPLLGALPQTAPTDPMALRARDSHQDLLIAADPVIAADRYKDIFGKQSPYPSGIMAIDVYFRNDNNIPVRVNLNTVRLVISLPGVERQRLEPLSPEEVTDRMLLKGDANPRVPRPFPFPSSGSGKSKAWKEMDTMLRSVAVSSDVLPPIGVTHGFLFFDMNHDFEAIRHAHLYIPDLAFMTNHQALFFFELDLGGAAPK